MEREGRERERGEAKLRGRGKSWLGRDYFSATGENRSASGPQAIIPGQTFVSCPVVACSEPCRPSPPPPSLTRFSCPAEKRDLIFVSSFFLSALPSLSLFKAPCRARFIGSSSERQVAPVRSSTYRASLSLFFYFPLSLPLVYRDQGNSSGEFVEDSCFAV